MRTDRQVARVAKHMNGASPIPWVGESTQPVLQGGSKFAVRSVAVRDEGFIGLSRRRTSFKRMVNCANRLVRQRPKIKSSSTSGTKFHRRTVLMTTCGTILVRRHFSCLNHCLLPCVVRLNGRVLRQGRSGRRKPGFPRGSFSRVVEQPSAYGLNRAFQPQPSSRSLSGRTILMVDTPWRSR